MTITRFAPSPTGYLHLGHAYSALVNADYAAAHGGTFLLRIEDIDHTRVRPQFYAAIEEDLHWLGLDWPAPVLVQSTHLARYEAALAQLAERGLVYRCFKSRKDIEEALSAPHQLPGAPFTSAPLADHAEREKLTQVLPFAWRLSVAAALGTLGGRPIHYEEEKEGTTQQVTADLHRFGDVVLGRKDGGTSYHLASVLDDAMQGVTHVIRGEELREVAGLHALLQRLLELPSPTYNHHPMLLNSVGQRLSKRDGALAIREMREAGQSPQQVRAQAFTQAQL